MTSIMLGLAATFFIKEMNSESIPLNLLYSLVSCCLISEAPKKMLSR